MKVGSACVLFMLSAQLFCKNLAIDFHKKAQTPITDFQIFAERCTGSQYVAQLLQRNLQFNEEDQPHFDRFGHKHFPPWFSLGIDAYHGPQCFYTFEGSAQTLFVVVFRNPYDWVRSFHKTPHHGKGRFSQMPFKEFIRHKWILKNTDPSLMEMKDWHPLIDRDPKTGDWFENILKMRTAKASNMIAIADKVDHIYFIQYETARDHPEEVVEEISQIFGIPKKKGFQTVDEHYRGNSPKGRFVSSQYPPICFRDLLYINTQLDPDLEKWMGYSLTADIHEIR